MMMMMMADDDDDNDDDDFNVYILLSLVAMHAKERRICVALL
jgi:hypothetical protein